MNLTKIFKKILGLNSVEVQITPKEEFKSAFPGKSYHWLSTAELAVDGKLTDKIVNAVGITNIYFAGASLCIDVTYKKKVKDEYVAIPMVVVYNYHDATVGDFEGEFERSHLTMGELSIFRHIANRCNIKLQL